MKKHLWAMAAVIAAAVSHDIRAEVPVLSAQELRERATHVVVGKVQKVYASTSRDKEWETTEYVAEIAIETVEKGDGVKPGEVAYARYWHTSWIGSGQVPPHASGHRPVAKNDDVRAFLVQDKRNKGLDVILPNGFEIRMKKGS